MSYSHDAARLKSASNGVPFQLTALNAGASWSEGHVLIHVREDVDS